MYEPCIVSLADRPELAPKIAWWLWNAFWHADGYTLDEVDRYVATPAAAAGPPQCFVLLSDGVPVGTASLAAQDLDERPELTPWLAGVYVLPEARGRGHATRLIAAVEDACRSAAIPILWLYTSSAEGLYARLGWIRVETVLRRGRPPVALMRRDFAGLPP